MTDFKNQPTAIPAYVKDKIEAIHCRGCGAERASCIAPQRRTVLASVAFEGQNHRTEFCYERVYDYFESFRPPGAIFVPHDADRVYPCDECGILRTKAEGGTTFTVCDGCWDRLHPADPTKVQGP